MTDDTSQQPEVWPPCESHWNGDTLVWTINGDLVTDKDLRNWCYRNMRYPEKYVNTVRQVHVEAWAHRNDLETPREERQNKIARLKELVESLIYCAWESHKSIGYLTKNDVMPDLEEMKKLIEEME